MLFYFSGLLALILIVSHGAIQVAGRKNAQIQIAENLEIGLKIFTRLINARNRQLADSTRLLSGDFAFKTAYSTNDHLTILSALANHKSRIGADVLTLVSLEGGLVADTLNPKGHGTLFSYPDLLAMAEKEGEAYSMVILNERLYQAVVLPLLAPMPVAWIFIGFVVDDMFADNLKKVANMEVSIILSGNNGKVALFASTLTGTTRDEIVMAVTDGEAPREKTFSAPMGADVYETLITTIGKMSGGVLIDAVLQRSLSEQMKPYNRLRDILVLITGAGLIVALIAGLMLARTVSSPVETLVEGVKLVRQGDYTKTVVVDQKDEMGMLADSINQMTKGLADRQRVRSLLGKVVSPEIAEELLKKDVQLGGEEKEATILFSDIRSFTTFSEAMLPGDILTLLNIYFTRMNAIVEKHGGVVDKYIGDALMALFGVPLYSDDHADRALRSAIEMIETMKELNQELVKQGMPKIEIGIGINTAEVIAGNMGSQNRLNYTVIGDGVNVASRLETLSTVKEYNAKIVVSEATINRAKGLYYYKSLGEASVKGKSKLIKIYSLLGVRNDQL